MSNFKASAYQIMIQECDIEGETYFVGSVVEIPDVAVYEDSHAAAYEAISQVIEDLYLAAKEEGRSFPLPLKRSENQVSGRVTLRLPKTLHATLERQAKVEETSLNQHMVYLLADASARVDQMSHVNIVRSQDQHMVHLLADAGARGDQMSHVNIVRSQAMRTAVRNVVSEFNIGVAGFGGVTPGSIVKSVRIGRDALITSMLGDNGAEDDMEATFEAVGMNVYGASYARN